MKLHFQIRILAPKLFEVDSAFDDIEKKIKDWKCCLRCTKNSFWSTIYNLFFILLKISCNYLLCIRIIFENASASIFKWRARAIYLFWKFLNLSYKVHGGVPSRVQAVWERLRVVTKEKSFETAALFTRPYGDWKSDSRIRRLNNSIKRFQQKWNFFGN